MVKRLASSEKTKIPAGCGDSFLILPRKGQVGPQKQIDILVSLGFG